MANLTDDAQPSWLEITYALSENTQQSFRRPATYAGRPTVSCLSLYEYATALHTSHSCNGFYSSCYVLGTYEEVTTCARPVDKYKGGIGGFQT